jgi:hypothetical protein
MEKGKSSNNYILLRCNGNICCRPPRFDLRVALKQQLYRERKRLERQQRLLEGHSAPHVSATAGLDLLLRSLQLEDDLPADDVTLSESQESEN